jgi:hypothetical protein
MAAAAVILAVVALGLAMPAVAAKSKHRAKTHTATAATRSLYLVGTASPKFPVGRVGKVAVVGQAALALPILDEETVPIAVRNNKTKPVTEIQAQGVVRSPSGKVVATGSDQGFDPTYLKPGHVALGFIYLSPGTTVPAGSKMTVQVSATRAPTSDTYQADLLVKDVNDTGQQIVGIVKNPRHHAIQGPYSVNVYCLSSSGDLSSETGSFADASANLTAGATSGFTVDLDGASCPRYLVGASGFDMAALDF